MSDQYVKRVPVPDLGLGDYKRLVVFTRRKICSVCELVDIDVGYDTYKGTSFEGLLDQLGHDDEIRLVSLALFTRRTDDLAVALVWNPLGDSYAEVGGTNQEQVQRVADTLANDIDRRQFLLLPMARRSWLPRLRRWLREVSVGVASLVVGTGALAVIGVAWALLR